MLEKIILERMYVKEKRSMQEIADLLGCSLHKVSYWISKHKISSRSISEAVYLKNNPDGDPFIFTPAQNAQEHELFGLGMGLYWGEGTKANKDSVRLGNTDPELIKKFIFFLISFFGVKKEDMRFGLQIFSDITLGKAMDFWMKSLKIKKAQFYKPVLSPSQSRGTYKRRSLCGVLTVYYHNKKLRDLLVNMLPM